MSINKPGKKDKHLQIKPETQKKNLKHKIKFFIIKNKSKEILLLPFHHKNGTLYNSIFKVNCKNATIGEKWGNML